MRDCYQLALLRVHHAVLHVKLEFHVFELPNVKQIVVRATVAIQLVLAALVSVIALIEIFKFLFNSYLVLLLNLLNKLSLKPHLINSIIKSAPQGRDLVDQGRVGRARGRVARAHAPTTCEILPRTAVLA